MLTKLCLSLALHNNDSILNRNHYPNPSMLTTYKCTDLPEVAWVNLLVKGEQTIGEGWTVEEGQWKEEEHDKATGG